MNDVHKAGALATLDTLAKLLMNVINGHGSYATKEEALAAAIRAGDDLCHVLTLRALLDGTPSTMVGQSRAVASKDERFEAAVSLKLDALAEQRKDRGKSLN